MKLFRTFNRITNMRNAMIYIGGAEDERSWEG